MATNDRKEYHGRSGGGGGQSYDDEGRGYSKSIWNWFETAYAQYGYPDSFLFSIEEEKCYQMLRWSTDRYGLRDFPRYISSDRQDYTKQYLATADSRCRRLVTQKGLQGEHTFRQFYAYMVAQYEAHIEKEKKENEDYTRRQQDARDAAEAQRAKLKEEDLYYNNKTIELIAGSFQSEFQQAFSMEEIHFQPEGDELDDSVEGYISGYGFVEETKRPQGIKLQVTVSLDLSNSMYYNEIWLDASHAFREIGLSLKSIKEEHPDDLYVGFFTFSEDEGHSSSELGKHAVCLTSQWDRWNGGRTSQLSEGHLMELQSFSRLSIQDWWGRGPFDGEDTWISPLFEEIEKWEKYSSEPGASRLDIIISDAVLEHESDIREASKIQERRDGNLQTVILNFMPEDKWGDGSLPRRCVQYPAHADNIGGLLRQIVQDFVATQV